MIFIFFCEAAVKMQESAFQSLKKTQTTTTKKKPLGRRMPLDPQQVGCAPQQFVGSNTSGWNQKEAINSVLTSH